MQNIPADDPCDEAYWPMAADNRPRHVFAPASIVDWLTLIVLIATLGAACYAGLQAKRLAGLTDTAITTASNDARLQRDIAANAEMDQLRAYVGIVRFRLDIDHRGPNPSPSPHRHWTKFIHATVKNSGLTPAYQTYTYLVTTTAAYYGAPPPTQDQIAHPRDPNPSGAAMKEVAIIDKDQSYDAVMGLDETVANEFADARRTGNYMYIMGHIDLCDVYQRKWRRPFLFYFSHLTGKDEFTPMDPGSPEIQMGYC